MNAESAQYKVLLSDVVQRELEAQRVHLGFHSSNALSSIFLTQLSKVEPSKVWEALATLNRYHKRPTNPAQSRR